MSRHSGLGPPLYSCTEGHQQLDTLSTVVQNSSSFNHLAHNNVHATAVKPDTERSA
jgi:hypothetical protein